MSREVKEWIGKDDNAAIPPRVKLRIKARANDCCQVCGVRVRYGGQFDHRPALINGGENRESKIEFVCKNCHSSRTKQDLAIKRVTARKQKHLSGFEGKKRTFWKPEKPPEPKAKRTWWHDDRGRLCCSFVKPQDPTP